MIKVARVVRLKERERLMEWYSHQYRHLVDELDYCRYCGETALVWDHCPNLFWVDSQGIDSLQKRGTRLLLVPSCVNCNGLLCHSTLLTIDERKLEVARRLRRNGRKLLSVPAWDSSEIQELKGRLNGFVADSLAEKKRLARRLDFAEGRNG